MIRLSRWIFLGVILGSLPASSARAQQAVRWQPALETASRMAGQSNRLVLAHFWAEWCKPCAEMEREVFSRPEVARAIEAGFVPVKVNVDYFPTKVRQYGVSIVPTDVIMTPDGQLVDKLIGSVDASQYIARLNQITQRRGVPTEAGSGRAASGQPAAPTSQQPAAGGYQSPGYQASPPAGYSDNRYPSYSGGRSQPETSPARPPYADHAPAAGGADRSPYGIRQAAPPSPAYGVGQETPGGTAVPDYQPAASPYQTGPPASPYQTGPPASPYQTGPPASSAYQGAAASPYQSGGARSPYGAGPTSPYQRGAAASYQAGPPSYGQGRFADRSGPSPSAVVAPPPETSPAVQPPSADELPPGSPPLALDGFCPVRLSEQERWVRGDVRWGARHEGRTYLFAGPDEQQRFLADPQRYAPVYAGFDVVLAVEQGERVPGRREYGAWYHGKVYLFSSETSYERFNANPEQYLASLEQMVSGTARRPVVPPPGGSRETMAPSYGSRY